MNGRVFVRVFSPRRKDPITCEVCAGETFGALRCRLSKELGIAGDRGLLMHHGEHVRIHSINTHHAFLWRPVHPRPSCHDYFLMVMTGDFRAGERR